MKKKYVVRISDGLGNQMFQYALARKTGVEVLIAPLFCVDFTSKEPVRRV